MIHFSVKVCLCTVHEKEKSWPRNIRKHFVEYKKKVAKETEQKKIVFIFYFISRKIDSGKLEKMKTVTFFFFAVEFMAQSCSSTFGYFFSLFLFLSHFIFCWAFLVAIEFCNLCITFFFLLLSIHFSTPFQINAVHPKEKHRRHQRDFYLDLFIRVFFSCCRLENWSHSVNPHICAHSQRSGTQ